MRGFLILFFFTIFACSKAVYAKAVYAKQIPHKWELLKKELKNRQSALTSPMVQRRLERIHRVMGTKDSSAKAIALIEKLEKVVAKRPSDLARLYRLKAQIYLSGDHFKKADSYYNKAIRLKALTYREHLSVLYYQALLRVLQNDMSKASRLMDQLFYLTDKISPSSYVLKAFILTEQKQTKSALETIMKALRATSSPKEGWLALAAGLNIELKQYVPAIRLLTQLTATYPKKKKYWKQLSALYLNVSKDDRALATLDLAYKLDFLEKEQEILHLASLLLYQGLPFKCARLIERSMQLKKVKPTHKNYESLGDCWMRAYEMDKALQAYEKSAPFAKDGKLFAKVGRIYMSRQDWPAVVDNLKNALNKGGVRRPEHIYIALGAAYTNLKKYESAVQSFEQVIHTEAKGKVIKTARQWINYVGRLIKSEAGGNVPLIESK